MTIVAHAGDGSQATNSPGVISVGTITTSAPAGEGAGSVTLIGQGGVITKAITTKGGIGGAITIAGAEPQINGEVSNRHR